MIPRQWRGLLLIKIMKFNYQGRTKDGEIHTGQIEASSKEVAVSLLQKHELYVTFLEEAMPPIYAKKIKFFDNVSQKDIVLFSRQLSIMFSSKVPLVESLRVLSTQTQNSELREKIIEISEELEGGTTLSQSLARYPKIFSSFYVAMIKSGEISGKLAEVLNYLADHLEREYHLAAKTKGALIYPALIVVVVIAVLALMVFFVIPQLATIFEASSEPLPFLTRIVISGAAVLRRAGFVIILLLILSVFFVLRYYRSKNGKRFFDRLFLKLPLIGPLLQMIYITRFAENFSTLISGGLPVSQCLETVGDIMGNTSYQEVVLRARDEVRKGVPISTVLSSAPEIFPPMFVQMALVGEKTGTLDTTLMNIVDFYQKEIDMSISNVLNVLEPLLIVILGVVVGGIMLSILMPLYRIISL